MTHIHDWSKRGGAARSVLALVWCECGESLDLDTVAARLTLYEQRGGLDGYVASMAPGGERCDHIATGAPVKLSLCGECSAGTKEFIGDALARERGRIHSYAENVRDMPSAADFASVPIARRGDPTTSHVAAEDMNASGARVSQANRCLQIVTETPGLTAGEIAHIARFERGMAAAGKRLYDLEDRKFIRKGDARVCTALGTTQVTWFPA